MLPKPTQEGDGPSWYQSSYWKLRFAEFRKDPEATKIWIMRFILACFLLGAAAGLSAVSYKRLNRNQKSSFESNFKSVAQNALNSVSDSFERINLGIEQVAGTYAELYPDEEQWPYVAFSGFHTMVAPLAKISSTQGWGVFPIVLPEQVEAYNNYTYDYYQSRPADYDKYFCKAFPNGSIWFQNNSLLFSDPYLVTSGIEPPRKRFIPTLQYTVSQLAGDHYVGYDVGSDPRYMGGIQNVINCTRDSNYSVGVRSCGGITEVTPMPWYSVTNPHPVIDDMTAVFFRPIFPANNHSKLVGFAAGSLSWAAMLRKIVPTFVRPIDCVVKAHDTWFTFTIIGGMPKFKGFGDLHETEYSKYRVDSGALSPFLNEADINSHRMSIYPTQEFHDEYYNFTPWRSVIVICAIFVFCSVMFYGYDILMKREFSRSQAVLDTKRRFVRFISHEIRTPLNTVRLGLKLFEEELETLLTKVDRNAPNDTTTTVRNALVIWKGLTEEILESSDSAVEVLDDLLNYDKIEIGTLRLEFGLFDMRELVVKCTSTMQAHAKQKGITLTLQNRADEKGASAVTPYITTLAQHAPGEHVGADLSTIEEASSAVVGDATRLSQVLRNLISNALKFTPSKGTVTVTVGKLSAIEPISEKVRLSSPLFKNGHPTGSFTIAVKDSGAGLTELQLKQICSEGVQFNANELQAGQGSGLGLFIAKGIVEQHGGRLIVASEGLNQGVTFTVVLPLFRDDRSRRSSRRSAKYSAPRVSFAMSGDGSHNSATLHSMGLPLMVEFVHKKILVVDDSPFNRKMLVRLLTSKGFECEQAEDGADAVRVYQEFTQRCEAIDAILMDFEMPVMNGPTATKKLRELGCTCLIIGVTGNVLPDQVGSFKSHGADAVLPKPLVMEDLQYVLNSRTSSTSTDQVSTAIRMLRKGAGDTATATDMSFSARAASGKVHAIG